MRQIEVELGSGGSSGGGGASSQPREVRVLVTGYGPFLDQFPINSSWSIASTLPDYLPATSSNPTPIRIVVPKEPLKVAWRSVLEQVPKLLGSESTHYDLVLHIGLAADRNYFALEMESFRDRYENPDVDGKTPPQKECHKLFKSCPEVLKPTFDCKDVWTRWMSNVEDGTLDLQCSNDPGNYLCGFIYYLSMSWYWNAGSKERPVMFFHVPDLPTEEDVQRGREATIGLIRALVESRRELGVQDPLNNSIETESKPELS